MSHGRRDWSSDGRLHVAQSRRDDLDDVISTVRLGLGRDLAHSLSLSMGVRESKNHLKVKQKRKWFSGLKGLFYSQSLRFSIKLYFTCAPKHAAGCKIFSGNHLHPKQTQPLSRLSKSGSYVGSLKVSGKVDRRIRLWIVRSYIFSNLKQKTHW